jgi:uncharacterized protein (TIGR02646 family)
MRMLKRSAAPKILQEHGDKWNKQWKDLKTQNPKAQFQWYKHESRSVRDWIINDLAEMTNGHCAFCDRFTVEPESVEHFRPKSSPRFLHLAYSWENLFFCCGGCQTYKLERWDDGLLDPTDSEYRFERFFRFDFQTGQLSANPYASAEDQQRARITIEIYGLDSTQRRRWRVSELRRSRRSQGLSIDEFAYRNFVQPQEDLNTTIPTA